MSSRAIKEPLLAYWWRQFKEEPLRVLIFGTLAALVFMYQDGQRRQDEYRRDAKEQNAALIEQIAASTATLGKMSTQLELLNNRVGHLEREHEMARKAALPASHESHR